MDLIAKHLDRNNLKYSTHKVDTICCFTGKQINEGVRIVDLVSDVFTDWEYVKHNSGFASIEASLCIADVIKGNNDKRNNSLRNYSYFATENELRFLSRQDILELLLDIPTTPFLIAISYNNKKHTSYKTILNTSKNNYVITTDLYNVVFDRRHVDKFLQIIQNWYSIIPEKSETSAQPTYFTKDEILHGNAQYHKQLPYGIEKFEEENEYLKQFRNTNIFELIVHLINKSNVKN